MKNRVQSVKMRTNILHFAFDPDETDGTGKGVCWCDGLGDVCARSLVIDSGGSYYRKTSVGKLMYGQVF